MLNYQYFINNILKNVLKGLMSCAVSCGNLRKQAAPFICSVIFVNKWYSSKNVMCMKNFEIYMLNLT